MTLTARTAHRKDLNAGPAKMEHRHFATVAAIIRALPDADDTRAGIAHHFANHLRSTNPNFNRDRFIAACMSEEG